MGPDMDCLRELNSPQPAVGPRQHPLPNSQQVAAPRGDSACVKVRLMVSIKEATGNAAAFAREALGPERTEGMRLEELESTTVDGKDAWLITLSMIIPGAEAAENLGEALALFRKNKREYKRFTVMKQDGEVRSMKIRELVGAGA